MKLSLFSLICLFLVLQFTETSITCVQTWEAVDMKTTTDWSLTRPYRVYLANIDGGSYWESILTRHSKWIKFMINGQAAIVYANNKILLVGVQIGTLATPTGATWAITSIETI